ncbi:MAG TPA: tetratricopeptide repeat protein, partial [Candidatus Xenobia bacterium]
MVRPNCESVRFKLSCLLMLLLWGPARAASYDRGWQEFYLRHMPVAIAALQQAVRQRPSDPMAHFMLSRAYFRNHQAGDARRECQAALRHLDAASDEQRYMLNAWGWRMRPQRLDKARNNADYGIAMYPDSAELYILRGEIEDNDLLATPYYLAALRLSPTHPLGRSWKPVVPPVPTVRADSGPVTLRPLLKAPALFPGLGQVHHPIVTANPKAQAYFTQGLCCLYAYVYSDARTSFEEAIALDPKCAMAWWGLSFCTASDCTPLQAASRALSLATTDAEKRYGAARVLQVQKRNGDCIVALDGALAAYPNDVDLWIWRGTVTGFLGETYDGGRATRGMPFILAAWRLQPDEPAANHELIHSYENINRPLLGWKYTIGFGRSAPNMPHAQHMQAHLAMRLGRWKEALACTRRSIKLELAGFPDADDAHHRNIYMWALCHEGRFVEASHAVRASADDL